jgi:cleavage and polyadenylation specificity factor subunit 4
VLTQVGIGCVRPHESHIERRVQMASFFDETDLDAFRFEMDPAMQAAMRAKRQVYDDRQTPCANFFQGRCKETELSCRYSHKRKRTTRRGDREEVCKHWPRGICQMGEHCNWIHKYDDSKIAVCTFYLKGECTRGEGCEYRHITERETKECRDYTKGFCEKGPRCKFRNGHIKKLACKRYLAGFCPDGPRCRDGHPKCEWLMGLSGGHIVSGSGADDAARGGGGGGIDVGGVGVLRNSDGSPVVCFTCGQRGHMVNQCPRNGNNSDICKATLCFKCGEHGHYANLCPNGRREPPPEGWVEYHQASQRSRGADGRGL